MTHYGKGIEIKSLYYRYDRDGIVIAKDQTDICSSPREDNNMEALLCLAFLGCCLYVHRLLINRIEGRHNCKEEN